MKKILVFVTKNKVSAVKVDGGMTPVSFCGEDSMFYDDIDDLNNFRQCVLSDLGLNAFTDAEIDLLFIDCGANKENIDCLYNLCHDAAKVNVVSIEKVLPWLVWNKKPLKSNQLRKVEFGDNIYDISCDGDNFIKCSVAKVKNKVDLKIEVEDFAILFEINAQKMIGGVHENEVMEMKGKFDAEIRDKEEQFIKRLGEAKKGSKCLEKKLDNIRKQSLDYFFEPGNIICLGKWKKRKIAWIVLDVNMKNRTALLLCRDGIDIKKFDESTNVWEESSLRKWLNDKFLSSAFKDELSDVVLDFAKSQDRISIMNEEEFNHYSGFIDDIKSCSVVIALPGGDAMKDKRSWWLRSAGKQGNKVSVVKEDGKIRKVECDEKKICVRPFCWIDIDALLM